MSTPTKNRGADRGSDRRAGQQVTAEQVMAWVPKLLRHHWRRLTARTRRAVWITLTVPTVIALSALPAYADGGNAPAALSWIEVKDSYGISIWQYEMSLDRGGVRNPVRSIWAIFVDLLWQIYRGFVALACWLVDWTLSMDWLGWITKSMISVGDNLSQLVDQFGVAPALLTMTAVVAVLWMAKGQWVLGIFELFMSLFIASLAIGILANPVKMVAGEDGMIINSRDAAMSIAAGLQGGDSTDTSSDQLRQRSTGMLAETFLRKPQQLINFGVVIDGTKCEKPYDEAVKGGPYGEEDDLREAMSECEENLGEVAENPNAGMVMSLAALMPAGFVALLFTAILCGVVLVAGVYALYQALKMIVALVLALLPNGARGSLWMTFAELILSMVTIVFSIVFLAAYLMLIESVFATGQSPMATFFIVDVLLVVGIVVFWKGRQRIKASAEKLAQAMSKRPGGAAPSSLPGRSRMNPSDVYYKSRLAAQGARTGGAAFGTTARFAGQGARTTVAPVARAAYGPVDRALGRLAFAGAAAGTTNAAAASPSASGQEDAGERLQQRLLGPATRRGQLGSGGVKSALAAASGGTVPALAAAGKAVALGAGPRRTALKGRLQPTPQLASSRGPRPSPPTVPRGSRTATAAVAVAVAAGAVAAGTAATAVTTARRRPAPTVGGGGGRTTGQVSPPVDRHIAAPAQTTSSRATRRMPQSARPPAAAQVVLGQVITPSPTPISARPGRSPQVRPAGVGTSSAPSSSAAEQQLRNRLAARQRRPIAPTAPAPRPKS